MSSASKKVAALGSPSGSASLALGKLTALQAIHVLPDSAWLTTSEAAVMLRSSVSTLERMRSSGKGPRYHQAPGGPNQPCLYKKADLAAWLEKSAAVSVIAHAKLQGLVFATIHDVAEPLAFYVDEHGDVESLVESNLMATVVDRLGAWDIQWLSAVDACGRTWTDQAARASLAEPVGQTLAQALRCIQQGAEATELRAASVEASEQARHGVAAPPKPARADSI